MVFDDDAIRCGEEDQPEKISDENWVDEFGCFYIKTSDTLSDIINGLNDFYHNANGGVKKRKITTQKKTSVGKPESEIGAKKSKQAIKNNKIEDSNDEMCESEYYEVINRTALIELCYYCDMSKLDLESCLLCFHKDINYGLSVDKRVNFLSLVQDVVLLGKVNALMSRIRK